jgi:periplasmic protein CpxP/Spy
MPRISQHIVGLAAATLFGAALLAVPGASAQQASPPPAQMAPAPAPAPAAAMPSSTKRATHPRASREDRVEAKIKSLHTQLKITPDEESEWTSFAQVMRDNAQGIDQLAQQRAAKRSSMSAVDNLKSYEAIADAHADEMKKLVPAFEALYDKMPDAQKQIADTVFGERQRAKRTSKKAG